MLNRFWLLFLSVFILLSSGAFADPPQHAQARLLSAVKGVGDLTRFQAGVEVRLEEDWKTYWRTPGEAGLAPVFDWNGSRNIKDVKVLWPAPQRFVAFDIDNYGYENVVTFPLDVALEKPGAPATLQLRLNLLICHDICVPESHTLSLTVPPGDPVISADHSVLAAALEKVPDTTDEKAFSVKNLRLEEGTDQKAYLRLSAVSATPPGKDADMFVEYSSFISAGRAEFSYDPATQKMEITAPLRAEGLPEDLGKTLTQPFTLTVTLGDYAFERPAVLTMGGRAASTADVVLRTAKEHFNPRILLLAFIGGLILNLMPCVLPVLLLKVLSVLKHGGKDHRIHRGLLFRNFMASAAGIIFSFWLMAGALALLKAAGSSIGWGIQFQHTGFLIFLIGVLSLFAANLWGLFDIPLPRFIARNIPAQHEHEPSLLGHFLTGAFATLLATPCTAPFLGTAVGFALAGETTDIFTVFTFLGLGLSFPYILLSLFPHVFKYMPKPGRWMGGFKKILALTLALTAAWLFNVLVTVSTQATLDRGWTTFDEALIKPAVAEGKTVVVDITADWCLTCKANKRLVLEQKDIAEALSEPNILLLQGDWTHRDETIASYLKKYGRYGIPFNIVYGPNAPEGIILSELLTKQAVMRALLEAAGE